MNLGHWEGETREIVPDTYSEVLMFVQARRSYQKFGPSDEVLRRMEEEGGYTNHYPSIENDVEEKSGVNTDRRD